MEELVAAALRSVVHECDSTQAERFHAVFFGAVVEQAVAMLREVIERGIERAEVRPDAARGYVFDLIPTMTVCRFTMCGSQWPDTDVEEMIGRPIVLLLRPSGS